MVPYLSIDLIKKKVVRYLLQRYMGDFFDGKLDLDQLSISLLDGTGSARDVKLSAQVRFLLLFWLFNVKIFVGILLKYKYKTERKLGVGLETGI